MQDQGGTDSPPMKSPVFDRTDRTIAAALFVTLLVAYLLPPLRYVGNDPRPALYTAVSL